MIDEKVSVIIPIYNVEVYLKKCIDSVLKQTYQNLEIILVNDGSTDRCKQICDDYGKKYQEKVKVIHKKNGGLSSARNAGIDVASGELIAFVDSDDYIEKNMIEKLYSALKYYDASIAICNLRFVNELDKRTYICPENIIMDECIDQMRYWEKVFEPYSVCYVVAWNKLYRKKIWQTLRYPDGKLNEDEYILHQIISQCDKIACVSYVGYNYVQRTNSIMSQKKKEANFDLLEAWLGRINYFNSIGREDLSIKQLSPYIEELIHMYHICKTAGERESFKVFYKEYQMLYENLCAGTSISLKEKIKKIGCGKCPKLMNIFMRVYSNLFIAMHKWINLISQNNEK